MGFLQINTPNVVHESIEGEVVIVNLEKGLYFSTDGVGAAVWTRLAAGQSIEDVRGWLDAGFADADTVSGDLDSFVEQLRANELVTDCDATPQTSGIEIAPRPDTYTTPVLEIYSDMEELLLLDPIHEVNDEVGWPKVPT